MRHTTLVATLVSMLGCGSQRVRIEPVKIEPEATLAVRPLGGFARIDDAGVAAAEAVASGGLAAGVFYGILNWLDLGAEIAAMVTPRVRYAMVTMSVEGNPQTGELSRTTQLAQARVGATLRLGVASLGPALPRW